MRTASAILLALVLMPSTLFATVEYSRQTGKSCGTCHMDPSGGGALTAEGGAFRDDLRIEGLYRPLNTTQQAVRLVVGYLHMMTAIIWFGTILYVHILLKPAYAARGLPRGELLVGWASIAVMAVTGTMLAFARVASLEMLYTTRFGVLLVVKVAIFLLMVSTAAITTFVIGPRLRRKKALALKEGRQDLTAEELSQFDGRDGRAAYVGYAGNIYDVSQSGHWRAGSHVGKHLAGADLTGAVRLAPHGGEKVTGMPLIGKLLASGERPERPPHVKVFYFFAYMNLALVFLTVFVISLWRWW